VGPASAPIERIKGNWRWHFLVKAPAGDQIGRIVAVGLAEAPVPDGVTRIVDVDPVGML